MYSAEQATTLLLDTVTLSEKVPVLMSKTSHVPVFLFFTSTNLGSKPVVSQKFKAVFILSPCYFFLLYCCCLVSILHNLLKCSTDDGLSQVEWSGQKMLLQLLFPITVEYLSIPLQLYSLYHLINQPMVFQSFQVLKYSIGSN